MTAFFNADCGPAQFGKPVIATKSISGDKRDGVVIDLARRRFTVILVGVGGQGVLTAADILGRAAHAAGLPVMVGQLHGMTQRGGAVECSVLVGRGSSSHIGLGSADVLVAFEPIEAERAIPYLGPHTRTLINRGQIVPFETTRAKGSYPQLDDILQTVQAVSPFVSTIDGPAVTREVGVPRTLNVVMLGAAFGLGLLPLPEESLWHAISFRLPPRFLTANRKAFDLGRQSGFSAPNQSDMAVTFSHGAQRRGDQ